MKGRLVLVLAAAAAATAFGVLSQSGASGPLQWGRIVGEHKLFNGWTVRPAGTLISLAGDMPGRILFTHDNRYAIVGTHGYNKHTLNLIDLQTGQISDSQVVDRSSFGLSVDGDSVLLSGGRSDGTEKRPDIYRWKVVNGKLVRDGSINLPDLKSDERFVTSIYRRSDHIFVANAQSNEVFRLDTKGNVLARVKVGYRPRMVELSQDGTLLAVSEWGDSGVALLDSQTLETKERIKTLAHPTAMTWDINGRLFIAESGSNTILQYWNHELLRTTVSIDEEHPVGPTPTDLTLAHDGSKLFVTLAGENAVAVVDISHDRPKVMGHIPTSRWPSSVAATRDGRRLLVATAKGLYGPSARDGKAIPDADSAKRQMVAQIASIDLPDAKQLRTLSQTAKNNIPKGVAAAKLAKSEVAEAMQNLKKVKHVIYVIKENKTFDQVLGDVPGANGDPSVTIFGEAVTPNQHELARRFVLLDNLYSDGEASQVGHQWTDSAYANEYTESQWSSNYGGHGELDSDERLTASPGDYLWSAARKKGHWARVYGEYVDVQEGHDSLEDAEIKADPERWGYCAAWERVFAKGGRDTEKLDTFLAELKQWERTGKMPSLMVMALPDDHTHGYSAGSFSPKAMVGDNDLAVGRLVEAISRSRFWKETAIFVIQDDTQGGLDHVDSHRTYGFVIAPFTQRKVVDSTHYTTASMLRTMELILGLEPMSSYDAVATPMLKPFLGKANLATFRCLPPPPEINDRNPAKTQLAMESTRLDWSDIDLADPEGVSRLLWKGEKAGTPYPDLRR